MEGAPGSSEKATRMVYSFAIELQKHGIGRIKRLLGDKMIIIARDAILAEVKQLDQSCRREFCQFCNDQANSLPNGLGKVALIYFSDSVVHEYDSNRNRFVDFDKSEYNEELMIIISNAVISICNPEWADPTRLEAGKHRIQEIAHLLSVKDLQEVLSYLENAKEQYGFRLWLYERGMRKLFTKFLLVKQLVNRSMFVRTEELVEHYTSSRA
jgi:hypothetical protein